MNWFVLVSESNEDKVMSVLNTNENVLSWCRMEDEAEYAVFIDENNVPTILQELLDEIEER